MARRSLKPQLNQIRSWVRQGRTDAWIAHQLEVTVDELREFRNQHGLTADEDDATSQEIDLRDEIEAEIEAAAAEEAAAEAERADETGDEEVEQASDREEPAEAGEASEGGEEESDREGAARPRRRRRRGRRAGRGRRKEFEATFDHGEQDGYGLWLDAAIKDNPVYTEHWAGKRDVTVRIESDQIVIRRAGEPESEDSDE